MAKRGECGMGEREHPEYTQTRIRMWSASKTNAPVCLWWCHLRRKSICFLNVRRKRLLVSPFGKESCDINERHNPF